MASRTPFFSIIIPTYNRPQPLRACLQKVNQLDYPRDRFEVIVVDDGSKLSMEEVVEPFQKTLNLSLLRQNNTGPAQARNNGAAVARGEYIAFTDDDCMPSPLWLQALARGFDQTPNDLIGGKTINALIHNPYSTASQTLTDFIYDYRNLQSQQDPFLTSNNFAFPKHLFLSIGGFNTTFPLAAGEDRELCDRWLTVGHKINYLPDAIMHHAHHLNWKSFCKQHFNYGRSAVQFHHLRENRGDGSLKPDFNFYWNLIIYPFLKKPIYQASLLSLLMFTSQFVNVLGFFWEKFHQGKLSTPQPIEVK